MDQQGEMAVFVRVVEHESFSSAARALKLTPSAVSKLIGRLEDRLGARLLNRTTRRLSMTEEGHAFYQRCVPILSAIDEAEMAVTELHAEPRGLLKVNASTAFGQFHIQPLIPKFLERHPDLRIQLTLSDSLVNLVEEEVDVAIRIADMPDSTLIAKKLSAVHRTVAAAPSYIEKFGIPKSPEDLKNHNCLTLSFETSLNQWEFKGSDGPQRIRVRGSFETNNAAALYEAGLAGLGLFRAANFVVGSDFKEGRLIPVLEDYEMINQVNIYAVYPHSKHLSPKVRAFVDLMIDAFTPIPSWEM
ncbi:MAG: LysR family transcriptional regulator [Rhodospirillales bacterium]|jgi:DNA-binding transcriptional LysR family regulator|tara:strand:+ start:181 stop:1086 length:906 start_codon:yes stop_codon:yes gene_type:complete